MKKALRLTENDLHNMIRESIYEEQRHRFANYITEEVIRENRKTRHIKMNENALRAIVYESAKQVIDEGNTWNNMKRYGRQAAHGIGKGIGAAGSAAGKFAGNIAGGIVNAGQNFYNNAVQGYNVQRRANNGNTNSQTMGGGDASAQGHQNDGNVTGNANNNWNANGNNKKNGLNPKQAQKITQQLQGIINTLSQVQ